jgi:hypothetical protein
MFQQSNKEPKTELCKLFYKYGSDKCPQIFHSYSEKYYEIVKDHKFNFENVLEIGIGTNEIMKPIVGESYQIGSSLRAWRDFFVNAEVFGLDIDKTVLFNCERISTFYTDQSNGESLLWTIGEIKREMNDDNLKFDLIIDDGSHIISHMTLSFEVLSEFLKPNGIYIIEDIKKNEISYFINFLNKFNTIEIKLVHHGNTDWDGFIAIKKIK